MSKAGTRGLQQLGLSPRALRYSEQTKASYPGGKFFDYRKKKKWTKKELERLAEYEERMAKLFTIERLTPEQKDLRQVCALSKGQRSQHVKVTLPKLNIPDLPEED